MTTITKDQQTINLPVGTRVIGDVVSTSDVSSKSAELDNMGFTIYDDGRKQVYGMKLPNGSTVDKANATPFLQESAVFRPG